MTTPSVPEPALLRALCPRCGGERHGATCAACGAPAAEPPQLVQPVAGRNEAWMALVIAVILLASGGWLARFAPMAAGAWTALSVMGLTAAALIWAGASTLLRPVQVWEVRAGEAVALVHLRGEELVHAVGGPSVGALDGRASGWSRGKLPWLHRLLS